MAILEQWTEVNSEFGNHELTHHHHHRNNEHGHDTETDRVFKEAPSSTHTHDHTHMMEFDYGDELPSTAPSPIRLRGKTHIQESTGLTIWTASQVLTSYLLDHPYYVQPSGSGSSMHKCKSIMELGAGMGLCSIAAHHLGEGRTHVVATDGDVNVFIRPF